MQTIGCGQCRLQPERERRGALTLAGAGAEGGNPAQGAYKGITVNGGTLNIGSADAPKTS
ncbi:MAG: hypothetical protein ACLT8E_09165 [Akkermansia sp.]